MSIKDKKNYAVLLRGINVSGKNIIKMVELKSAMIKNGMRNVKTYIQSGNIIFETDEINLKSIIKNVESIISTEFDLNISAFAYTLKEFKKIIASCPFSENLESKKASVYIFFSDKKIEENNIQILKENMNSCEEMHVVEKEIYFHFPNGYSNTKLTNNFLEKKLQCKGTTRNLNTCQKIISLA